MMDETASDDDEDDAVDIVEPLEGVFVGSLTRGELAAFDLLCARHIAYRSYEGVGGFMGLAKVRLHRFGEAA